MNDGTSTSTNPYVATLTFHEALNYGAVLQAFALQKALRELGVQTEVLNYSCPGIRRRYMRPNSLKGWVSWVLKSGTRTRRKRKFDAFLQQHVTLSAPVQKDELPAHAKRYGKVIVGSDQVWNLKLTGFDTTYFLDFAEPVQRCAYAASIGSESLTPDQARVFEEYIPSFSRVTVREASAARLLAEKLQITPDVVCDPVFLVSGDEWKALATKPSVDERYVLLLTLAKPSDDCLAWAKAKAAAMGCKLVAFHNAPLPVRGVNNVRDAGPDEYLGWIIHAESVITNSFHACCLSIMLDKELFWFNGQSDTAGLKKRTARIKDLLEHFGMQGCEVNTDFTTGVANVGRQRVADIIERDVQHARRALEHMLEGSL